MIGIYASLLGQSLALRVRRRNHLIPTTTTSIAFPILVLSSSFCPSDEGDGIVGCTQNTYDATGWMTET